MKIRFVSLASVTLAALLFSGFARATLGEKAASISDDAVKLKIAAVGKRQLRSGDGLGVYSIDETTVGTDKVRQYIAADGTIFAIAWRGASRPNINVLLGTFSDRYQKAQAATGIRRRAHSVVIKANGLIVHQTQHARLMTGQMIATDLVPSGVKIEDLQ